MTTDRACAWCGAPLGWKCRDAVTCSKRCRQARARFASCFESEVRAREPRRFAYADPPYPGLAHYYRDHPDFAGEVDHVALARELATFDAWALSTSADALPDVLEAVRASGERPMVAAWFRGERPNTGARRPLSAWEPVVYARPRLALDASRIDRGDALRRTDALVHVARPRTTDDERRVIGAKPGAFWSWLFRLLGAQPGDVFVDLFPGSGGGARAWAEFESKASNLPANDASE